MSAYGAERSETDDCKEPRGERSESTHGMNGRGIRNGGGDFEGCAGRKRGVYFGKGMVSKGMAGNWVAAKGRKKEGEKKGGPE